MKVSMYARFPMAEMKNTHKPNLLLTVLIIFVILLNILQYFSKSYIVPPIFLQKPNDLDIIEGTSAEFNCLVSGKPTPMIKWTKNGNNFILFELKRDK